MNSTKEFKISISVEPTAEQKKRYRKNMSTIKKAIMLEIIMTFHATPSELSGVRDCSAMVAHLGLTERAEILDEIMRHVK